jgi:hypothetical protein
MEVQLDIIIRIEVKGALLNGFRKIVQVKREQEWSEYTTLRDTCDN